jgi:hypothetical protein
MLTRYEVRTTIGAWDEKWVSRVSLYLSFPSSHRFRGLGLASFSIRMAPCTYPYLVLDSSIKPTLTPPPPDLVHLPLRQTALEKSKKIYDKRRKIGERHRRRHRARERGRARLCACAG